MNLHCSLSPIHAWNQKPKWSKAEHLCGGHEAPRSSRLDYRAAQNFINRHVWCKSKVSRELVRENAKECVNITGIEDIRDGILRRLGISLSVMDDGDGVTIRCYVPAACQLLLVNKPSSSSLQKPWSEKRRTCPSRLFTLGKTIVDGQCWRADCNRRSWGRRWLGYKRTWSHWPSRPECTSETAAGTYPPCLVPSPESTRHKYRNLIKTKQSK